jgi:hypothetical protein
MKWAAFCSFTAGESSPSSHCVLRIGLTLQGRENSVALKANELKIPRSRDQQQSHCTDWAILAVNFFVVYLTTLSVMLHDLKLYDGWWTMNWEGCESGRGLIKGIIRVPASWIWVKQRETSIRIVGVPAKNRTWRHPNISQQCCRLSQSHWWQ